MKVYLSIQQILVKEYLGVFLGTGDKVLKKTGWPHAIYL